MHPLLEESSAIKTTYTDDMAAIYMPCDAETAVTATTAAPWLTRVPCWHSDVLRHERRTAVPSLLEGRVSPRIKAAMTSKPPTRGICMPCAPFVKNLAVLPFLGWSLCVPCLPGFVSKEGDPSCRPCPANAVPQITAGANGQLAAYTECAACNRDSHGVVHFKFGKNPDLSNAYGDHGSVFGVTVCIACNSVGMNHYRDPTTGQCRTCEAGKASSSGTAGNAIRPACDVCAPGYYRNETGGGGGGAGFGSFDFRCQKCPAGKFTSNVKDIAKLPFDARCKNCPAGRSTDGLDGLIYNESGQPCTKCTGQTVAEYPGTAKCKTCKEMGNEMVRNAEGTGCRPCKVGTSRNRLVDQNVSTFLPDYGTQWRAVLRGVRLSPSPDGCVWCAPGYHRDNANANDKGCEACPVGKYQPEPKGTTCLSCPSGRYTDATAQVRCKMCPLGRATKHELRPAPAETFYETEATGCLENCQITFAWKFAEQFDGVQIVNTTKGPLGNLYPSLSEGSKACCTNFDRRVSTVSAFT